MMMMIVPYLDYELLWMNKMNNDASIYLLSMYNDLMVDCNKYVRVYVYEIFDGELVISCVNT